MAPGIAVWRLPVVDTAPPIALACPKSASLAVRPSYRTFLDERSRCTMDGLRGAIRHQPSQRGRRRGLIHEKEFHSTAH